MTTPPLSNRLTAYAQDTLGSWRVGGVACAVGVAGAVSVAGAQDARASFIALVAGVVLAVGQVFLGVLAADHARTLGRAQSGDGKGDVETKIAPQAPAQTQASHADGSPGVLTRREVVMVGGGVLGVQLVILLAIVGAGAFAAAAGIWVLAQAVMFVGLGLMMRMDAAVLGGKDQAALGLALGMLAAFILAGATTVSAFSPPVLTGLGWACVVIAAHGGAALASPDGRARQVSAPMYYGVAVAGGSAVVLLGVALRQLGLVMTPPTLITALVGVGLMVSLLPARKGVLSPDGARAVNNGAITFTAVWLVALTVAGWLAGAASWDAV